MTDTTRNGDDTKARIFVVIENFLAKEAYSGFALFSAALLAMMLANFGWSGSYFDWWHTSAGISIGDNSLTMDLRDWVNDGLMAVFFLLIGLEVKRELVVGELSSLRKAAFPVVGAVGGMLVPMFFYIGVNLHGDGQLAGFGVPMATDIAFVLGFLLLLGSRVPLALKVFLVSLAVFDDLGAIILVAVFYTGSLDWVALGYAAITLLALTLMGAFRIKRLSLYLILGIVLWFWVEQSGIHATLAGVMLALTIPLRSRISSEKFLNISRRELATFSEDEIHRKSILLTSEQQDSVETMVEAYEAVQSPLVRLEHHLHPITAYFVMPLFAFANAGVRISDLSLAMFSSVSLGILLGLLVGKPLGIAGATYVADRLGWARKPSRLSWKHIIGAAILGGVGFTMSIFITDLAFADAQVIAMSKLIIVGTSLAMGIVGTVYLLRMSTKEQEC